LRIELNKPESKYISREVKVNGGTSYEILFSSLEPELQDKLRQYEIKSNKAMMKKNSRVAFHLKDMPNILGITIMLNGL